MRIDRKTFLRVTACSVAGALAGGKLVDLVAGTGEGVAAAAPGAPTAKRLAMVIDTRKCLKEEGCDKCMTACHQVHNVPEIPEKNHEVKWIWKEPFEHVFPSQESEYLQEEVKGRPTPVLCNHCDEPPCVRVCPTQATWKRDTDGIVMMDWHRCIGCRYCMAACPYGSRSFNWFDPRSHIKEMNGDYPTRSKGVVEKCTFCDERLAKGQLPACVEACTEKAMVFGDLADPKSEVRELVRAQFTLRRRPQLGTKPEVFYIL